MKPWCSFWKNEVKKRRRIKNGGGEGGGSYNPDQKLRTPKITYTSGPPASTAYLSPVACTWELGRGKPKAEKPEADRRFEWISGNRKKEAESRSFTFHIFGRILTKKEKKRLKCNVVKGNIDRTVANIHIWKRIRTGGKFPNSCRMTDASCSFAYFVFVVRKITVALKLIRRIGS